MTSPRPGVDGPTVLPMFPLGSVTVPGWVLSLQVFEPRYLALVRDCLASDSRFGTVLIERGSEVGGGDVRCDVGTFVHVVEARPAPDGRWAMFGVGTERLRVVQWLEDAPYPRAVVEPYPESPAGEGLGDLLARATQLVRAWLRRSAELGVAAFDPEVELPSDAVAASHMLSVLSPLGPLDRQDLLARPGPDERLAALIEGMDGQIELLEARFGPDGR